MTIDERRAPWLPSWLPGAALSLLRIITGAMFMQHGVQKLFGLLLDPSRPWSGAPPTFSQFWFAGVLETFGGLLIVLGLFTRPVAFLLSGEMAVAYFQMHAPRAFWPILNGGEVVVLFCFIYLYLFAAGPGPWSLDAILSGRGKTKTGMYASRSRPARTASFALLLSLAVLGCRPAHDGRSAALPTPAARGSMLIGADSLAARMAVPRQAPLLLHVARTRSEFDAGHIPGARFLRLGDILVERDGVPNELPPRARLDSILAAVGVPSSGTIVVYGEPLAAARAWFTLDVTGHASRAAMLDGGLEAWRAGRHPVSTRGEGASGIPAGRALPAPSDGARVVDADWIEARRSHAGVALIDARPPEEFGGERSGEGVGRPGHIPGARNLFWKRLILADSLPTLVDTGTLRTLFVAAGAAPGDTVVTYCRTGMQASYAYFAARYLGYETRMYDGSYLDWERESSRPVSAGRD